INEIFGKNEVKNEVKEGLLRRALSKIFKFKTLTSESKKSEVEKLVIAIDNIDRCHKEQAFEILLTIKSFLGKEGVVFIIPIDDKGLKKHLKMSEQEANEFLRKLFNTSLQIRKFSDNELFDYGMQLVEKYGINIPEKNTVISMITQEYSKNPRRIIQFLNTLQTEFYLAQVQEEKGYIPKESITNNIKMLVKLLIIREEFPEIYEKIIDKPELIQEISKAISSDKFSKNKKGLWEYKGEDKQSLKEIKLTEEQYRFFMRTSNIVMDAIKLEPFFVNRDLFKDLPDRVYNLVISQDWEELKNMIESGKIKLESLMNYINDKLNEDVIKRGLYDTSGFNLLSLIFKIIHDKGQKIEDILQYINIMNIKSVLENDKVYKYIYKFPAKQFIFSLRWFKERGIT
ncbi:MAG: P-loop NTPase fold protein, partial [Candidatus Ratteibacteria bacterium]